MGIFFKTFFVCLIMTFSFLLYKYFSVNGYDSDLKLSSNNPIFGAQKELSPKFQSNSSNKPSDKEKNGDDEENEENIANNQNENTPKEKDEQTPAIKEQKEKQNKYTHTCYFYSKTGALTKVSRQLSAKPSIENSILILLKGPLIAETKQGIYSEIPANVDLINVKSNDDKIIVNLTSNFGNGGGSKSVENRIKQLSKTIKIHEPSKKIYLYINGKEVEYLGGEGVFVKQPLDY